MAALAELKKRFSSVPQFQKSPLYTSLAPVVAENDFLLRLAARCRREQDPTFLFFGAVHYLLLGGAQHELAAFYPSIVGEEARPPEEAGPAFISFCVTYEDELSALLATRLVQTNAVRRSLALRLGFVAIGRELDAPVHLIDVGASAGIHLRFDRFGYTLGGRPFGDRTSAVQIAAKWDSEAAVPDLDAIPPVASAIGVDLHPVSASDPSDRRWLEALVWPDNRHEADLLHEALSVVAVDPPEIRTGNAIDVCPMLGVELPPGEPRVVFHSVTRTYVPLEERDAFDDAVASLGRNAPLYVVTLEGPPDPDPRLKPARPGPAIYLRRPSAQDVLVAVVAPRLDWVEPMNL